jgi:hypothetical protein
MKLGSLLPGLVFVLLLSSCSKDFDASSVSAGPKLARILVGGNVNQEFSYDEQGRLVKYTGYLLPGGIKSSESVRYYDNAGKLIKTEDAINISSSLTVPLMDQSYSELSYDSNNKLKETKSYHLNAGTYQYTGKSIPDYDAEGRIIAVTLYSTSNQAYAKTTYQYNTLNNITAQEFFQYNAGIQGPSLRSVYEHDNKKNPFQNIWVMPFGANPNNITKQATTNYVAVPANPSTNTSLTVIKSYNSDGYPTLVNENGVDYVYEYK